MAEAETKGCLLPSQSQVRAARSKSVLIGGFECSFASEVPDDCCCSICLMVLQKPHLTECCGQDYCRTCIQQWLRRNRSQSCPNCRAIKFKHIHDKKAERRISQLEAFCTHKEDGCTWRGVVADLKKHLHSEDGCLYYRKECPNGCSKMVMRKDLATHADLECCLRIVECEYCHQSGTFEFVSSEHPSTCSGLHTTCPNGCGKMVTRKDLATHADLECCLRIVECEYCHQSGTFEFVSSKHPSTCPGLHVTCPNGCGKIVREKDLQSHFDNDCRLKCPFYDIGCQTILHHRELEGHITACQSLHLVKAFHHFGAEIQSLKLQLENAQKENETVTQELKENKQKLSTTQESVQALSDQSKSTMQTLTTELDFFHPKQAAEAIALECIKTRLDPSLLLRDGKVATFRLSNFSHYQQTGQAWYSPPFYIHNGYKMCFTVHPNGVGAGKKTHVSIYFHQLAGEFDSNLKWPYRLHDTLQVRLLRQVQSLRPDSPSLSRRKSAGSSAKLKKPVSPSSLVRLDPFVEEQQPLNINVELYQIANTQRKVGPPVAQLELFCLQSSVRNLLYCDSLVFQLVILV